MRHFQRTATAHGGTAYRVLIPVLPWVRTGYDVNCDQARHGLWIWHLSLAVELDGRPGFAFSMRWGWVERATVVVHEGHLHG